MNLVISHASFAFNENSTKIKICKRKRCTQTQNVCIKTPESDFVLIGDSLVANLRKHYPNIWKLNFPNNSLELGIGGDHIEHVWYRCKHGGLPFNGKIIVTHIGTNNIDEPVPVIVEGLVNFCNDLLHLFRGVVCCR